MKWAVETISPNKIKFGDLYCCRLIALWFTKVDPLFALSYLSGVTYFQCTSFAGFFLDECRYMCDIVISLLLLLVLMFASTCRSLLCSADNAVWSSFHWNHITCNCYYFVSQGWLCHSGLFITGVWERWFSVVFPSCLQVNPSCKKLGFLRMKMVP